MTTSTIIHTISKRFNSSSSTTHLISNALNLSHINNACIIGSGVAGLQCARALQRIGIKTVIYEKCSDIGGVWRENYINAELQTPIEQYLFPEYSYAQHNNGDGKVGYFPSKEEIQDYIQGYANKFNSRDSIHLDTEVTETAQNLENGSWNVTVKKIGNLRNSENNNENESITKSFDLLVIATGMYHTPNMPAFADKKQHSFKGPIYHSSQVINEHQIKDKKCVIIGAGKSAIDIAVACAKVNQNEDNKPVLIARRMHWAVPRFVIGLIPLKFVAYNRFAHFFVPPGYYPSTKTKATKTKANIIHRAITYGYHRIVELLIGTQFRHIYKGERKPKFSLEIDSFEGGILLNNDFQNAITDNSVAIKQCVDGVSGLTANGVQLANESNEEIKADAIIFGTGFTKNYSFFDAETINKLDIESDGHWLYKHILPSSVSNLAFIGSEVASFTNIVTHYLQSEWLAGCISGKIEYMSQLNDDDIKEEIQALQKYKRSFIRDTPHRAYQIQLQMQAYHDQLTHDLGYKTKRKSNTFAEIIMPYTGMDYIDVNGAQIIPK